MRCNSFLLGIYGGDDRLAIGYTLNPVLFTARSTFVGIEAYSDLTKTQTLPQLERGGIQRPHLPRRVLRRPHRHVYLAPVPRFAYASLIVERKRMRASPCVPGYHFPASTLLKLY